MEELYIKKSHLVEWTEKLLIACQADENNIEALEQGYYDTHDVQGIEAEEEEIRYRLDSYRNYLPKGVYFFSDCKVVDKKLVSKY